MKKYALLIFSFVTAIFIMSCISSDNIQADATFTGTIAEITEETALVDIEEGVILNSGTQVIVDLSVAEEDFEVGDHVQVGYTGEAMESDPLQITTLFVEKTSE